jgi:hypothetical protein
MHARSLITLCIFAAAALVALKYPVAGRDVYFLPRPLSEARTALGAGRG